MLTPRMKDAPRLKELFLSVLEISFPKFAYLDCLIGGIFRSFCIVICPKHCHDFHKNLFPCYKSMEILIMIVNNIIIVYLFKGHKK